MNLLSHYLLIYLTFSSILLYGQEDPSSSNLSSGTLFQLEIPESGIYELTHSYMVSELGISASTLTPQNIRILSGGEGIVPPKNSIERSFDAVSIPIHFKGVADGSFDPGDKVLFFAPGPHTIAMNEEGIVEQKMNPYDFSNYVFLQIGSDRPSESFEELIPEEDPQITLQLLQKYKHHEKDLVNLQDLNIANYGTGQRWLGESFSINRKQDFTSFLSPAEEISSENPSHVSFHFAGRASRDTRVRLSVNNQKSVHNMDGTNLGNSEHNVANPAEATLNYNMEQLAELSLEFLPNSGSDQAWLDYITFNYSTTALDINQKGSFFVRPGTFNSFEVDVRLLGAAQNIQIVNITDFPRYYKVPISRSIDRIQFRDGSSGEFVRYAAFDPEKSYPKPTYVGQVANQSLKSMDVPNCLVVYPDFMEPAVDRWADHRAAFSKLTIEKAEIQQVYNEFSGGKADPGAIRDLARYLYEKSDDFEYLLLFGAASFDYRHINKNQPDYNFVPTYQTPESYDPIFGYPTDDYFALIRPNQGGDLVGALALNVGRLPARSLEEAHTMVDKIIRYETSRDARGEWQSRFVFLADDSDNNLHIRDADNIAENVRKDASLITEKIYFDAFTRSTGAGGVRFPDATAKLNDAVRRGALVVNYLGHGGPFGWASERVLTNEVVQAWTNSDKLPLFVTATCTFGTYDQQALESTGELLINKGSGGAIALFTTSRPVYSSSNRRLTASTFDKLFETDEHGFIPIGKVLTEAKNANRADTLRANARKYTLLGDPTMRILLPNYQVITTAFNGVNAQMNRDTIGPLERVSVQGYIAGRNGLPIDDYQGILTPTLFDKVIENKTLGQSSRSQVRTFNTQENVLWKGNVAIENGQFEFTMIVPKSINEDIDEGKIHYFAASSNPNQEDAKGAYSQFYIGGVPKDSILNPTPPEVHLYLENEMFQNGDKVGPNPMMYVTLFDSLGINLSNNGLGKEMVAILDDNTNASIVLNSFYEPDLNDSRAGRIFYPLTQLEPGYHTLKVRAWNILGMPAEAEIEFFVVDQNESEIFEVAAYPNPFTERVCIQLKSKLPVGKYNGFLEVFNSVGQLIDEVPIGFLLQSSEIPCIEWRPKAQNTYLSSGTYYARLRVEKNNLSDVLYSPVLKLIKI